MVYRYADDGATHAAEDGTQFLEALHPLSD
jgi:hypothetical protein